jgi:hypothetical protein
MTKAELKQKIKEVIQEEIQGYSKYLGKTKGGTTDDFRQILTKIAKGEKEEKVEETRSREILTADALINHLKTLTPDTRVSIPKLSPGGFSRTENESIIVDKAIEGISRLKSNNKFEKVSDTKFWLYQTPEEMEKMGRAVRGAGSLD